MNKNFSINLGQTAQMSLNGWVLNCGYAWNRWPPQDTPQKCKENRKTPGNVPRMHKIFFIK